MTEVFHTYRVPVAALILIDDTCSLMEQGVERYDDGTASVFGQAAADLDRPFDVVLIEHRMPFDHFHADPDTGDYESASLRCYRPGTHRTPTVDVYLDVTASGDPYITLNTLARAIAAGDLPERSTLDDIRTYLGLPAMSVADWVAAHSLSPSLERRSHG